MEPIFHHRTQLQLETFLKKPSHAVILTGAEGSGKLFTAQWLADQLETPCIVIESAEGASTITIDQMRALYSLTRSGNSLVVVIKDAQELSTEAQNAFLKLLEEPPQNTRFVLTARSSESLLNTIRSRAQRIEIIPPQKEQLGSAVSLGNITEALFSTTHGLAGSFISLSNDPEALKNHQESVDSAKKFYTSSVYERHILCIENKYEKKWIQQLLHFLAIITQSLIKQSASNATVQARLIKQVELLEETSRAVLDINGNPKIHLTKICQEF
jgi:DNA polymerase-3 subunit delta'